MEDFFKLSNNPKDVQNLKLPMFYVAKMHCAGNFCRSIIALVDRWETEAGRPGRPEVIRRFLHSLH